MIETLDNIIRDRTQDHHIRMEGITLLRYMTENKNLENN